MKEHYIETLVANERRLIDELYALRNDAERYRKLVATGKYSAASIGGGWGLACGAGRWTKAELDSAADALLAVGAA